MIPAGFLIFNWTWELNCNNFALESDLLNADVFEEKKNGALIAQKSWEKNSYSPESAGTKHRENPCKGVITKVIGPSHPIPSHPIPRG